MVKFTIFGKPAYKKRPRARVNGLYAQIYSDPEQVEHETTIAAVAIENRPSRLLTGSVCVKIKAYYAPPKSISKTKRYRMLSGELRPTVKPDADNLSKIYLDAMNTVIYQDDKQVVDLHIVKYYDETPRVEIEVSSLAEVEKQTKHGEFTNGRTHTQTAFDF